MKTLSLLLSMLMATALAAQKPLDRGMHKRKTGGVSFLFGKDKSQHRKATGDEVTALKNHATTNLVLPKMPAQNLVIAPAVLAMEPPSTPRKRRSCTSLLPLNKKGPLTLVSPHSKQRLLHHPVFVMEGPSQGEATYDWASITGVSLGVLALLLIDSGLELMPWMWLLGLGFSVFGLTRTKTGNLRGQGLARFGVALFGITALVVWIGVATGLIGVF